MAAAGQSPLAVSMGEPAGIGPDLILQLWSRRRDLALPPFLVYGEPGFFRSRAERLGLAVAIAECDPESASRHFADRLPVRPIAGLVPDKPGDTSPLSGKAVLEAIARAVDDVMTGRCRSLVTAPIHKEALYATGFSHPGHTEYLAHLCAHGGQAPQPVMMLLHETLRVAPVTVHVALRDVPALITPERVISTARIVDRDLRHRFGIAEPRLALAGLNPHAGEGGALGMEELDVIAPAAAELRHQGLDVVGPVSADTLFHLPHWQRYDAVIAMYHDQALIPIKAVAFESAVNLTLGLPIVRTSPDHGTALDLAGKGTASPASFLAAIRLADRLTEAVGVPA